MRVFGVDPTVVRFITHDGSSFRLSPLRRSDAGEVRVDCAYLKPGDHIGRHPAGRLDVGQYQATHVAYNARRAQ